jgi:hypothetical protein
LLSVSLVTPTEMLFNCNSSLLTHATGTIHFV